MNERAFTVALIGADGAGKTTVARRLERELAVKYLYMGVNGEASNHQLPTTRLVRALKRALGKQANAGGPPPVEPGRKPPASPLARLARSTAELLRLANMLAEEWYRQLIAWHYVRRGDVVLFDRHFFADFWAHDVARARKSTARRLHGLVLERLYPQPDLTILLDAPVEVLWARKPEGTLLALARRRREYQQFLETLEHIEVVDAALSPDDVVREVTAVIERHAVRRAHARLHAQVGS